MGKGLGNSYRLNNAMNQLETIVHKLQSYKFPLQDEKILQREIATILPEFKREYVFDKKSTIDFFHEGIGIEIKIKGSRREIYSQLLRYCQFEKLKVLILVTNRAMGLMNKINETPCIVVNLGRAWM